MSQRQLRPVGSNDSVRGTQYQKYAGQQERIQKKKDRSLPHRENSDYMFGSEEGQNKKPAGNSTRPEVQSPDERDRSPNFRLHFGHRPGGQLVLNTSPTSVRQA